MNLQTDNIRKLYFKYLLRNREKQWKLKLNI
jgi:hypothetical protein